LDSKAFPANRLYPAMVRVFTRAVGKWKAAHGSASFDGFVFEALNKYWDSGSFGVKPIVDQEETLAGAAAESVPKVEKTSEVDEDGAGAGTGAK